MLRGARSGQPKTLEGLEMSIDWQNGAPDRSRTALPESYKPRALRLPTADPAAPPARPEVAARLEAAARSEDPGSQEPAPPVVDLRKLEAELGRKRLDEIADVVRALTYGEMMELAESMWNVRPEDTELTEHNLPAILYRWSTTRQQTDD
jgi:hypothetical protein